MKENILVINPGSTSTKLSIFKEEKEMVADQVQHSMEDLAGFVEIFDQYRYRLNLVETFLKDHGVALGSLACVVGRGGLVRPIACGTYEVTEAMVADLKAGLEGHHASNLGPALALGIAKEAGVPAYIVDPITVDEMSEVAKITGFPNILRESRLHALNHKAVARKIAKTLGKAYEDCSFVVCHLGTGSSVGAHEKGRVVDVYDARGEGPMSGDRPGEVNAYLLMKAILDSDLNREEWERTIYRQSGLVAHLGTKDVRRIHQMIEAGHGQAKLVLDAMIYQNAKAIGAMAAALGGHLDGIILTGGMIYDDYLREQLMAKISFLGRVFALPGEEEMEALAMGALRVLRGEEELKEYPK